MKDKILDKIAIVSALCCALHCALLPALLTIAALSGLQFLRNPLIEWTFIILGCFLAYLSLGPSLKRHQNHTPKKMAIMAIVLLFLSRLPMFGKTEIILTCLGSLFLIIAHFKNIQAVRRTRKVPV